MDYAENYAEFVSMLVALDYNKSFQLQIIERKLWHFTDYYETETDDGQKKECLKQVGKLNDLFTMVLVDKAYETLGIGTVSTINAARDRRDLLLSRYKSSGDGESLRAHGEVAMAFDVIQFLRA
jgi:hypothetical protein